MGWTPLSDRLKSTEFSQVDCHRSISNGTIFTLSSSRSIEGARLIGSESGRLGVVENIAHDGTVLVRSEFAPSRGADVRDKRNRPLGRVVKVFGPVREPFAAVRPTGAASLSMIGVDVFVAEGDHANQEDRR